MLVVIAARPRAGLRLPLLFRHHAWRARRRRSAQRCVRACDGAVAGLLRHGAVRRDRVAAHRRHDADQVRGRRHRFGRAAQRHPRAWRASRMMVVTSPKLSGLVIAAIPLIVLPLVAFGRSVRRKSRPAQDTLADATAYASEQIGAVRTLQAFTNERLVTGRFSRAVEAAFAGGALVGVRALRSSPSSPSSRSSPRWWRCCGSARATCCRARCRPARSASSCSIRCSPPARSARCRRSGANSARRPAPPSG